VKEKKSPWKGSLPPEKRGEDHKKESSSQNRKKGKGAKKNPTVGSGGRKPAGKEKQEGDRATKDCQDAALTDVERGKGRQAVSTDECA